MEIPVKKYLDKISHYLLKVRNIFSINPHNNWFSLVLVFVIINIFTLTGSILKFYNIGSDEALFYDDSGDVSALTINRESLKGVVFDFETRRENFSNLKSNRPRFPDPSI